MSWSDDCDRVPGVRRRFHGWRISRFTCALILASVRTSVSITDVARRSATRRTAPNITERTSTRSVSPSAHSIHSSSPSLTVYHVPNWRHFDVNKFSLAVYTLQQLFLDQTSKFVWSFKIHVKFLRIYDRPPRLSQMLRASYLQSVCLSVCLSVRLCWASCLFLSFIYLFIYLFTKRVRGRKHKEYSRLRLPDSADCSNVLCIITTNWMNAITLAVWFTGADRYRNINGPIANVKLRWGPPQPNRWTKCKLFLYSIGYIAFPIEYGINWFISVRCLWLRNRTHARSRCAVNDTLIPARCANTRRLTILAFSVSRKRSVAQCLETTYVFTRDSVAIARISHGNSVRPSVCLSVRHTGGSAKNGWS